MVFLLIFPMLLIFLLRYFYSKCVARSFIDSAVLFSAALVFMTELLSIIGSYNLVSILLFWASFCITILIVFRSKMSNVLSHLQSQRETMKLTFPTFGLNFEFIAYAFIALFLIITLVATLIYPNIVYDGLVFHLPRVFFWMQNESVHNFPTAVARQLYSGPFNAYAILQIFVLSNGSDYLLGLPQWFSYVGTLIVSGLIAKEFGLNKKWQLVSAMLALTIPISILQSVTVQNDLLTAFWVATAVYYVILLIKDKDYDKWIEIGILLGFSVGLSLLTKLSSAPFLLPFAILVVGYKLRMRSYVKFIKTSAIVLFCIISITLGFYTRNALSLNGDFLALNAPELNTVNVEVALPLRYRVVLITKNVLYNFGSPDENLSNYVDSAVRTIANALDVPLYSERINTRNFFGTHNNYRTHDYEPSPAHFFLYFFAAFVLLVYWLILQKKNMKDDSPKIPSFQLVYFVCCMAALLLTVNNFRWTPSAGRYLLPLLLISVPVIAASLHYVIKSNSTKLSLVLLLGTALYANIAIINASRYAQIFVFLSIPILIMVLASVRTKLTYTTIVAYTSLAFVCLYGVMILASSIGSSPLNLVRHARDTLMNENISLNEYRNRVFDARLGRHGSSLMNESLNLIDEHGITNVGILNISVGRATFPILRHFTHTRFRVENVIHVTHFARDSTDFVPQAIYAIRTESVAWDRIYYKGLVFVPIYFSQVGTTNTWYVFLLEESYYVSLEGNVH